MVGEWWVVGGWNSPIHPPPTTHHPVVGNLLPSPSFSSLRNGREEDGSSQDGVGRGEVGSWATSHLVPRLLLVARLADVLACADDDAFIPKLISLAAELVGDRKADLLVLQVRRMRLPGPEVRSGGRQNPIAIVAQACGGREGWVGVWVGGPPTQLPTAHPLPTSSLLPLKKKAWSWP